MYKRKLRQQQTTYTEESGYKPPKYDHCLHEKFTNYSTLPLTPLECPYENFSRYRIFSVYHPLENGGESTQIYAPNPEIGAPKRENIGGLGAKIQGLNFFPCFAYIRIFRSTMGVQNFTRGRDPPPRDIGKKPLRDANFDTRCQL